MFIGRRLIVQCSIYEIKLIRDFSRSRASLYITIPWIHYIYYVKKGTIHLVGKQVRAGESRMHLEKITQSNEYISWDGFCSDALQVVSLSPAARISIIAEF